MAKHWAPADASARVLVRRLLPVAIVLSIGVALLRWLGQERGAYGTEVGVALMLVSSAVVTCGLVLWTARELRRLDRNKRSAETERDRLFELSIDLLCTADLSGYFTRVNPAFERTLGLTEAELLSRPFIDFVHPDDRPSTLAELEKLAGGATTIDFENRYRCADGSYKWLGWRAVPVPAEGVIYAVARDVSAQKAIEHERERLMSVLSVQNDRLRKLDRMKNDMIAAVTHELSTPVNTIRGFLALVLDGQAGELGPAQREYLDVAHRSSDRLLRLIEDLLLVAKANAGKLDLKLTEVDLGRVVQDAVESARLRADEQGVGLDLVIEPLPAVAGDPVRLGQLADNLIGNAIKFTPPGGVVEVFAKRERNRVELAVADSGIGISREDQARVFDAFYRALDSERAVPGTGLGLAISKAIVEGHRGTIEVASTEGEGTTFTVRLPVYAEKLSQVAV